MFRHLELSDESREEKLFKREALMRERVCKIYNKKRGDFQSADEFNDYLEDIEDLSKTPYPIILRSSHSSWCARV